MSDLISREEAIQIIRSQGIYGSGYSDEERENNVIDMIESVPTAYDVERVVKELEEMEEKALRVHNYDVSFYATGQMHRAIEIVKGGGVNER